MATEQVVAKVDDLADGQMKEVQVQDRAILLLRVDGEFKAYAPECPHYGAPLVEGILHDGHLRCPWHQAVFDARNGQLIEPPALDDLSRYDVRIEGDEIVVTIPKESLAEARVPSTAGRDPHRDNHSFVIIGAGAAGLAAAEALRREDYRGRVVVLTREEQVSYDRTELSKRYLASPDAGLPVLRPNDFYARNGIEILSGHHVVEVDVGARTITCSNGSLVQYDKVLIATGGSARRLGVDGEDLDNVFTLRSLADCQRIRSAAQKASNAVVVGASFIGMEVAAALTQRGLSVTVVAPESVPFDRIFPQGIGNMYRKLHEEKGTEFRLGENVERFEGRNSAVQQALLASGEQLEADLVVVGIGVRPATDFLKGVKVNQDGSISVGANLRAGDNLFCAGDIARFPDWRGNVPIRIEHWRLAQQHGRTAARNMLEQNAPYRGVPFFWTNQHKVITQYVGYAPDWDDVIFEGDPASREFAAYYIRDEHVHAAAGSARSRQMGAVAELLKRPEYPTVDRLRQELGHTAGP